MTLDGANVEFVCRWVYFRGCICTANADGSIPMNSKVVATIGDEKEGRRLVEIHNTLLDRVKE